MPPIELTFGRCATEVGTSPQGGVEAAEEPQMDMLAFVRHEVMSSAKRIIELASFVLCATRFGNHCL